MEHKGLQSFFAVRIFSIFEEPSSSYDIDCSKIEASYSNKLLDLCLLFYQEKLNELTKNKIKNLKINRTLTQLQYGMVAVNLGVMGLVQMPFGGMKESGFGKEGSKYGLDDYLVIKAVHMGF